MTYFSTHLTQIGVMTLQHIVLVAEGLALALLVAIPLGVAAARYAPARTPLYALTGVVYVIPSLALLAVAVRYLGLGALPVVLVLAAYAQFILVRNISAAIRGVPAMQLDAARALGFTAFQRLWRVELPLAFPVILAGIRLATISLIAIAMLGGYVGAGGLGNDIFSGLQRKYIDETLAGSVPAALLAIIADILLRALERRSRARQA